MIDILMSTYNGAEYLPAQLDSILGQDFPDFRILIRDDGSSDRTRSILNGYAALDERVIVLPDSENLGAAASFMSLIRRSDADLFMFADQDDVWMPDKISRTREKMISAAERHTDSVPLAVFTDLRVVDEHLGPLHESFWRHQRLDPAISADWKSLLAQNVATGCTMLLNRAAKDVVLPFQLPEMMHDHWCAARVARFGHVEYLAEPTVLYRQHSANVAGTKAVGPVYAASKLPGLLHRYWFYHRAARVFGSTSAAELFVRKIRINLARVARPSGRN